MPRTEDGTPLTELLGELVAAAAATPGRPVGRKLPGGLHVAALKRPTHLALTAWRTANRLPSARECEILARDTGMLLPKISTFERQDGVLAFSVVDRASSPDQCDHRLGSPLHGDGRNESFWSWTCLTCGMTTTRLQARRGSRTRFEYGDQEVSETAWTILTVRGPRPWKELRQVRADLTASLTASAGARRESSGLAEPRPAPPARQRGMAGHQPSLRPGRPQTGHGRRLRLAVQESAARNESAARPHRPANCRQLRP